MQSTQLPDASTLDLSLADAHLTALRMALPETAFLTFIRAFSDFTTGRLDRAQYHEAMRRVLGEYVYLANQYIRSLFRTLPAPYQGSTAPVGFLVPSKKELNPPPREKKGWQSSCSLFNTLTPSLVTSVQRENGTSGVQPKKACLFWDCASTG